MKSRIFLFVMIFVMVAFAATIEVNADVTPASLDAEVSPGNSVQVDKAVTTPEIPPKLDLFLLVDLSASYLDDLPNINALSSGLFDDVRAGAADSTFGLGSFVDFPILPWGNPGFPDYAYSLDQDLTTDKTTWTGAINAMSVRGGGDLPESQYEALLQAAIGAGRDVAPAGASIGDIAAGQNPAWRPGATKVIAMTTDATFHLPTDSGGTYPGPSRDDTVAALNSQGIRVIALKAPGSGGEMDDIASATSGVVLSTASTSSEEIAEQILEGLGNIPITVTPVPVGCEPLIITFSPSSATVTSGEDANFSELVTVPNDPTLEGTSVHCGVDFQDDEGNSLGFQNIWIDISDITPPQVSCLEGVNPAGKTPKANTTNEDGFFLLEAYDNVDPDPHIFIQDLGSGTVFGPFSSPVNIKYVQAPGATPKMKESPGDVDYKITGKGDFKVFAVDNLGNKSVCATCFVPPLPK